MINKNKIQKNTIYQKKSILDQFYTSPEVAKNCYDMILKLYPINKFTLLIEPSAGTGSFYNLFPSGIRLGMDIEPKCLGVIKQDFFDFISPIDKKIATIGNPPFGKNASLAIKFFNKAAEFSEIIAFILPKTFQKISIQNKLNINFHLKYNINLPKNSFILNNESYDVPCCFQIWERSLVKRKIIKISLENDLFKFVKKEHADIAVRRVGGRTGKATKDIVHSAEVSHYFLKVNKNIIIDKLINKINQIDFQSVVTATAGVKSLSKSEFIILLIYNGNISEV